MWKQHELVMLPINEKAIKAPSFALHHITKCIKEWTPIGENSIKENTLSWCVNHSEGVLKYYQPQHLYILSSEEIKEGDWYMYCHFGEWIISNSRETLKNETNTLENLNKDDYFKKIIATTDFELRTPDSGMKAGYYMKDSTPLPRPSDDFIKAFVEKQGKIDKILVEYKEPYNKLVGSKIGSNIGHFTLTEENKYRLKINPDNTINIKPIKDSWNREEVIELMAKAFYTDCRVWKNKYQDWEEVDFNEWIEKNL